MMASCEPTFAASLNASIHCRHDGRVSFCSSATTTMVAMP